MRGLNNVIRLCLVVAVVAGDAVSTLDAQQPTRVLVRVVANDAKIIGTNVGGAHITVRDAETGDILAEGLQEGSTGSTSQIMGAWERGEPVFEAEGAAGYLAELAIVRPTRVEISAEGPLGAEHAIQTTTKSLLVIPGRDVVGEGIILELNGFTVEIRTPNDGALHAGEPFEVRARVTMLCGCPTEPGGMWDSNDYEILARLVRGTELVGEWPLEFSGTTSQYTASLSLDSMGEFELQVIASDPAKGNFGMATRALTVR